MTVLKLATPTTIRRPIDLSDFEGVLITGGAKGVIEIKTSDDYTQTEKSE